MGVGSLCGWEVYLQVLEKRNNLPVGGPLAERSLSAGSREEKQPVKVLDNAARKSICRF